MNNQMQPQSANTATKTPVQTHTWQTVNPPKDGTAIVVVGKIIYQDEFSTTALPISGIVHWIKDQSNYEGWHWKSDGMTVATTLEDEVIIDDWIHLPESNAPTLADENKRLREALSLTIAALRNGSAASPNASLEFLCDSGPREVFVYCHLLRQLLEEVAPLVTTDSDLRADALKYSQAKDTTMTFQELVNAINGKKGDAP